MHFIKNARLEKGCQHSLYCIRSQRDENYTMLSLGFAERPTTHKRQVQIILTSGMASVQTNVTTKALEGENNFLIDGDKCDNKRDTIDGHYP